MDKNKRTFMEMIEEEMGFKVEEHQVHLPSSAVVKLNEEINKSTVGNQMLLDESPAKTDRFPCSI